MSKTSEELALREALAAKGIGPQGNRKLAEGLLEKVFDELVRGDAPPPMEAAFLAAFRILGGSEEELAEFEKHRERTWEQLNDEQRFLIAAPLNGENSEAERVLKKLLSSTDLNESECEIVHRSLMSPECPERYKAAMLQGLRVKRETDLENSALLRFMLNDSPAIESDEPIILELCEPYDGYKRGPALGIYLAVILSSLGVPVTLSAVRGLGPKYGRTCLDIFDDLGLKRDLDLNLGHSCLSEFKFACFDQAKIHPNLYALLNLRNEMMKRPYLATIEKCLSPIRSKQRHVQVCGYVHKAYIQLIPNMLLNQASNHELVLLKGLEGGVLCDAGKKGRVFHGTQADAMKEHVWSYEIAQDYSDKECESEIEFAEMVLTNQHLCSSSLIFTASELMFLLGLSNSREKVRDAIAVGMKDRQFINHLNIILNKLR